MTLTFDVLIVRKECAHVMGNLTVVDEDFIKELMLTLVCVFRGCFVALIQNVSNIVVEYKITITNKVESDQRLSCCY